MRNALRLAALPLAISVVLAAGNALADLAPPPDYVESCTIDNAPKDQECHRCGAFFGNRTWCSDELASYGFSGICRTRGASVWGEIWCRPKAASNKPVPKEVLAGLGTPPRKVEDAGVAPTPSALPSASGDTSASSAIAPVSSISPPASPSASASTTSNAPPAVPPKQSCGACDVGGRSPLSAIALAASVGLALTIAGRRRASQRRR